MQGTLKTNARTTMKLRQNAYVAGIGMLTPVGVNTAMTVASVQAGISQYAESEYYTKDDMPITMASVPEAYFASMDVTIDEGNNYGVYYDHVIKMAISAIQEAVSLESIIDPIPLILAMPEPQKKSALIDSELLITNLVKQGNLPLSSEKARCIHTGRAAGLQALELGLRYLYDAEEKFVLIGGSDCYLSYPRLDSLDAERLSTPSSMDCFVPGEGAGFLLLTLSPQRALIEKDHVIVLHPPGIAEEPGHIESDEPYLGEGLDQAFKMALKGHSGQGIQTIYSTMNGERYWSKEYGVVLLRNKACFKEEYELKHPADCYGDLGAATSTVLMGIAAKNLLQQPGPGTSLVYGSSDSSCRGAVKLEKIVLV